MLAASRVHVRNSEWNLERTYVVQPTPFSFQRIDHVSNMAGGANAEGREEVLSEYLSGNDRGGVEDGEHGEDGERVRNRI